MNFFLINYLDLKFLWQWVEDDHTCDLIIVAFHQFGRDMETIGAPEMSRCFFHFLREVSHFVELILIGVAVLAQVIFVS